MATENLTPQTSASASSTTSEHVINPVIGKDNEPEVKTRKDQLAALKEEFELLQQKLKQFQETELENGGEKTSEDKETSVDSVRSYSSRELSGVSYVPKVSRADSVVQGHLYRSGRSEWGMS